MCSSSVVLNRVSASPRGHWAMSGDIFDHQTLGVDANIFTMHGMAHNRELSGLKCQYYMPVMRNLAQCQPGV